MYNNKFQVQLGQTQNIWYFTLFLVIFVIMGYTDSGEGGCLSLRLTLLQDKYMNASFHFKIYSYGQSLFDPKIVVN